MKRFGNEFKVGVFFLICIGLLFFLSFRTGKLNLKQEGYTIKVVFDQIAGLEKKAPVMLNGLEVGKVDDINVIYGDNDTSIELTLWIRGDVVIRGEPEISIKTLGLMGEKYIQISASQGSEVVPAGVILQGKPYFDMDAMMDEAQGIADQISQLVANVDSLTGQVKSLAGSLNDTVSGNQDKISRIISNLETTSVNVEEMSADIKAHPWKLLFKGKEK